ncbi:protein N-lysine methyltransferase METTL21A-like [Chenopodium quinoa]|uniref:Uncharacterized protein n=1 Tax=Chenopodium quinoa TaxID=63459 RepID=A0A803L6S7_CHEQI|nr:protein N-lysine methyltransferase METTL21A-like [Chenopodium quinoa]
MSTSETQTQLSSDEETHPLKSLLSPPTIPTDTSGPHFRRHRLSSLNTDVVSRQLPSEGLSFQLWPAATALFSLLDTHRLHSYLPSHLNRRLRVLELGSGTGLVGITAAAILGAHVTVTDLPHVIPNLEFNVLANAEIISANGGAVVATQLSWGNVEQMEVVGKEYDVILGSDVVYHDHLYESLLDTLKYLMVGGEREVVFLMAHLKRWKKESAFFRKARKFFAVDVIHRDSPSDGKRVGVIVYRFVAKQRPCNSEANVSKKILENDV